MQTILSWYYLKGKYKGEIPSIHEIQKILTQIDNREESFVGSKEWIGSLEISFILQKLVGIECQILNFHSGTDILSHVPVLKEHFQIWGSPIMIGGGSLAYTLLGVAEDTEDPLKSEFLILDPHYKGKEEMKSIINPKNKAVYWSTAKLFKSNSFYNLCCPH